MICPRCSIAEIREGTHQCPLCGFTPAAGVLVDEPVVDETRDAVQRALADRYRIDAVERLGERSFVYRAWDLAEDREVALKVVPVPNLVDHELAKRFERYVSQASALRHAHIVSVLQFGSTRSFLWYTMEFVRGRPLSEVLRESGPMELDRCLRIAEQVASALDFAHRHGVVHGNLKPTNILLDEHGWVHVSDFAVLEAFGRPREVRKGAPVLHRPEYLAPEQFYARAVGASADQYAFAVTIYQCLSGALPFVGDSFDEVARQHANDPPQRLSAVRRDLPVPTMEAVQRALSKTPVGRFPSVLDFAAALSGSGRPPGMRSASAAAETGSTDAPVLVVDQPRRLTLKRTLLTVGTIAVVLLLGSTIVLPDVRRVVGRWASSLIPGQNERPAEPRWETLDPISQTAPQPVQPASAAEAEGASTPVAPPQAGSARATAAVETRPTTPAAPGRLVVSSSPWGRLVVDDSTVGNTPQPDLQLPPGPHTVRVERDGYVPFETQIRIRSGEVLRLTDIVLEPRDR
jgi:serine/threonine protein kinase